MNKIITTIRRYIRRSRKYIELAKNEQNKAEKQRYLDIANVYLKGAQDKYLYLQNNYSEVEA